MDAITDSGKSLLVVLLALCLIVPLFIQKARRRSLPLPPGPKRWPIVGNAFSFPKEREWLTFMRWSREYGASCQLPYSEAHTEKSF